MPASEIVSPITGEVIQVDADSLDINVFKKYSKTVYGKLYAIILY